MASIVLPSPDICSQQSATLARYSASFFSLSLSSSGVRFLRAVSRSLFSSNRARLDSSAEPNSFSSLHVHSYDASRVEREGLLFDLLLLGRTLGLASGQFPEYPVLFRCSLLPLLMELLEGLLNSASSSPFARMSSSMSNRSAHRVLWFVFNFFMLCSPLTLSSMSISISCTVMVRRDIISNGDTYLMLVLLPPCSLIDGQLESCQFCTFGGQIGSHHLRLFLLSTKFCLGCLAVQSGLYDLFP